MLKVFILTCLLINTSGCMFTYLLRSSYYQSKLLHSRVPLDEVLEEKKLDQEKKEKLLLIKKVKTFVNETLKLKPSDNYSTYVELDQPYVTYLLRVSEKYQVKSYQWSFPFFGSFPYLGFFRERHAKAEQDKFKDKYDTYIRGVTAYSTLGWFEDPVLSSMLGYSDFSLVSLIIHESIHENLFLDDHVNFNEQLADFLGDEGAKIYFSQNASAHQKILEHFENKKKDKSIFIQFLLKEVKELNQWYKDQPPNRIEKSKEQRLQTIQNNFSKEVLPQLKTNSYKSFAKIKLNNARLLPYLTYHSQTDDFERVYQLCKRNFFDFFKLMKTLEGKDDPSKALKSFTNCY